MSGITTDSRLTILNTLKEDLAKIQVTNDYNNDIARVERGFWDFKDVSEFPFLCFVCEADDKYEDVFSVDESVSGLRVLDIKIVGYIVIEYPDFDPVHNLLEDLEHFLDNKLDSTYYDSTIVLGALIWEGSSTDRVARFVQSIQIVYHK